MVDSRILGIIGEVCVLGVSEGFDSSLLLLLLQELSGNHYLICHLYNFDCVFRQKAKYSSHGWRVSLKPDCKTASRLQEDSDVN